LRNDVLTGTGKQFDQKNLGSDSLQDGYKDAKRHYTPRFWQKKKSNKFAEDPYLACPNWVGPALAISPGARWRRKHQNLF